MGIKKKDSRRTSIHLLLPSSVFFLPNVLETTIGLYTASTIRPLHHILNNRQYFNPGVIYTAYGRIRCRTIIIRRWLNDKINWPPNSFTWVTLQVQKEILNVAASSQSNSCVTHLSEIRCSFHVPRPPVQYGCSSYCCTQRASWHFWWQLYWPFPGHSNIDFLPCFFDFWWPFNHSAGYCSNALLWSSA